MSLVQILLLLLIAGICGSIAQALVGYSRGGCFVSIAVGFIGAIIGPWIAGKLHLPELFVLTVGGTDYPVVWSIIGATVFSAFVGLISPRRA